jgi:putative sigma-54 modulation protein
MEITTTGRRYKLTADLKEAAEKRLAKLERYAEGGMEAHLVLAVEKYRNIAELTLHADGNDLVSREESEEMISSIDGVVDRMERQLKKLNARRKTRKTIRVIPSFTVVDEEELPDVEPEEEFSPVVVRGAQYHGRPLSVVDAIGVMRDKDWDLLLFSNVRTGKVCCIHLRPDGNFGLVEAD